MPSNSPSSPTHRRLAYSSTVELSTPGVVTCSSTGVGEPLSLLVSLHRRAKRIADEQLRLEEEVDRLMRLYQRQLGSFKTHQRNPNLLELVAQSGIHTLDRNWLSPSRLELSIDGMEKFCLAQTPGTLVEVLIEPGASPDRFVPFKSVATIATSLKKSLGRVFSSHHIAVLVNRLRDTFAMNGANPFWVNTSSKGHRLLKVQPN